MKKVLVLAVCAGLMFCAAGFAQTDTSTCCPMYKGKGTMPQMQGCPMMGQNNPPQGGPGGMGMNPQMMAGMQKMKEQAIKNREMIATSDGGVVIMIGNKLFKYDKELKLIAKGEIKMDSGPMQQRMKMMKDKMGKGKMSDKTGTSEAPKGN